jgi:hypothetical protein
MIESSHGMSSSGSCSKTGCLPPAEPTQPRHQYLTVTNYLVVQGLLMCCADWVVGGEIGGLSGGHSVLLGMH